MCKKKRESISYQTHKLYTQDITLCFFELLNIISRFLCPCTLNLFFSYYFSSSSALPWKLSGFIWNQCQSVNIIYHCSRNEEMYCTKPTLTASYIPVVCAVLVTRSFNVVGTIPAVLSERRRKWSYKSTSCWKRIFFFWNKLYSFNDKRALWFYTRVFVVLCVE
jgi:hypothetical protein